MHNGPSESTILRGLLEKAINENTHTKEKLENLLGELEVECDVSKDRTWAETYYCGLHGTRYMDRKETYICPVGKFALDLKKKYE